MILKSIFVLLLIWFSNLVNAQPDLRQLDFANPDSVAMSVKYHDGDLIGLSKDLTQPFNSDIMKVRAIYKWLIENIAYDYKFVNKGKEIKWPDCDGKQNCREIYDAFKWQLIKKAAKDKMAVCEGYASLFKTLCGFANVKSEMVTGSVRNKPYQIGSNTPSNHAWNAVLIDSSWYFIDATWAAGGCGEDEETGKLLPFHKHENSLYFLTPYEKFIKDHHPDSARWLALLHYTTKEKFKQQPFYYDQAHFIKYFENVSPDTGIINSKLGDTLRFSFYYPFEIEKIQVNTNLKQNPKILQPDKNKVLKVDPESIKRQEYWPFEKNGNTYTIKVVVRDKALYYIDILLKLPSNKYDASKALRYRINIPWINN